jgi:hypothetical protein
MGPVLLLREYAYGCAFWETAMPNALNGDNYKMSSRSPKLPQNRTKVQVNIW